MGLLNTRGIIVYTKEGTPIFYPAAGPVAGDKVVCYPVAADQYVCIGVDNTADLEVGDTVVVNYTKDGPFIFKPLYYPDPVPQPGTNIVLLQELTTGYGPSTGRGIGALQRIGTYSTYWDGIGELYISGASYAVEAFSVNDTFRLYKCYGYVDFVGTEGLLEGPLDVTGLLAGGEIFFKPNWVNQFKAYVLNNEGSTMGCGPMYLINVRPG